MKSPSSSPSSPSLFPPPPLADMTHLSLHDHDGSSGGASDQDTLHPLPHPGAAPWPMTLPYQFPIPHPYDLQQPFHGGPGAGSAGSQHSGKCTESSLRVVKTSVQQQQPTARFFHFFSLHINTSHRRCFARGNPTLDFLLFCKSCLLALPPIRRINRTVVTSTLFPLCPLHV